MGDIIHTLPAVAALRQTLPEPVITWLVEERWAPLIQRCRALGDSTKPIADKVYTVNTKTWRQALFSDETWREASNSINQLRCDHSQVVIDFQGAARSAILSWLSGADSIYGFAEPRENVASLLYTRKVQAHGRHIIEQNLSLAEAVAGRPLQLGQIEFTGEAINLSQSGGYVIINPGAGWGAKQWPSVRYGEVAKRLAGETGLRSLINHGPGEEDLAKSTEQKSSGAALAINCSPAQLITVLKRARLFVGGDTGPMHLAAALHVPVVAIFGPTDPLRNGPFRTRNIVLRSAASTTSLSHRGAPDESMLEITTEQVVNAALKLLREGVE